MSRGSGVGPITRARWRLEAAAKSLDEGDLDHAKRVVGFALDDVKGFEQELGTDPTADPAWHRKHLEELIRNQKREITQMREALAQKNKLLDAMHWVWCTGSCKGGIYRYHRGMALTQDVVDHVLWYAERLATRAWNKLPLPKRAILWVKYRRAERMEQYWKRAYYALKEKA